MSAVQQLSEPLIKCHDLFRAEGVIKAQHGHCVRYRREFFRNRSPYPLCWGIRGYQVGIALLKGLEFAHKRVIVCIADLRAVQDVIEIVMMVYERTEFFSSADNLIRNCRVIIPRHDSGIS